MTASVLLTLALSLRVWIPVLPEELPDLRPSLRQGRLDTWLYLRGGQLPQPGEEVVEVVTVGDVMPGRGLSQEPQPLAAVAPWLRSADLAVGNLECVVAAGGVRRSGPYRLRAPVSTIAALRDAGFDLLGLANNHALDYGSAALAETASRLHEVGIATIGAGPQLAADVPATVRQVKGVRLAFLAFNTVPDPGAALTRSDWAPVWWDRASAAKAIAAARRQADAVIVSIHWGYEYELRSDPAQGDMSQAMLDAGADLVVGHHPHVVQRTQVDLQSILEASPTSRGRFVAYSLGNLLFDQGQGETRQGLALRAFFDRQGLRAVQALPLWAGPRPRLMEPGEGDLLLSRIQPPDPRVGFACDSDGCRPVPVPQGGAAGPFQSGNIDLTGDGIPEQVRLIGQQLVVLRHGVEIWRGLSEWQVVDLALGDPNADGRGETMLALWKPDPEGMPRSHPFIVGHRGGAYRILWGGSPVEDPILEVELADLDGDGRQELIVLEEKGDQRTVAVWRWHGWGFSLGWRSLPGQYHDLRLVPARGGPLTLMSVAREP